MEKVASETTSQDGGELFKLNAFDRYAYGSTGLILKSKDDQRIIGRQTANGSILDLTAEDIELCRRRKLGFIPRYHADLTKGTEMSSASTVTHTSKISLPLNLRLILRIQLRLETKLDYEPEVSFGKWDCFIPALLPPSKDGELKLRMGLDDKVVNRMPKCPVVKILGMVQEVVTGLLGLDGILFSLLPFALAHEGFQLRECFFLRDPMRLCEDQRIGLVKLGRGYSEQGPHRFFIVGLVVFDLLNCVFDILGTLCLLQG